MKSRLVAVLIVMAMVFSLSACSLAHKDGAIKEDKDVLLGVYISQKNFESDLEGKETFEDGIAFFWYQSDDVIYTEAGNGIYDISNKAMDNAFGLGGKLMLDASKIDKIYFGEIFKRPDGSIYARPKTSQSYSMQIGSKINANNSKIVDGQMSFYELDIEFVGNLSCKAINVYDKDNKLIDTLTYEDVKGIDSIDFSKEFEYVIVESSETDYNGSVEIKRTIYNRADGEFVVLNSMDNGIVNHHTINFK
ncbi:MAG: hypothetical protein IJY81_05885 [Lachnospiraceae bacterium]|nr:hypothetical protein [Lachnospiraceae bacterium]